MTNKPGPKIEVQEDKHGIFKNISLIVGDGFELHLLNRFTYSEYNIPGYEFEIRIEGQEAGTCNLLIESDFNKLSEFGNYGVEITNRKYFGKKLPSRVAKACFPLLKSHGLDRMLITYDVDNNASAKTCQELDAEYYDTLILNNNRKGKKRYIVRVK